MDCGSSKFSRITCGPGSAARHPPPPRKAFSRGCWGSSEEISALAICCKSSHPPEDGETVEAWATGTMDLRMENLPPSDAHNAGLDNDGNLNSMKVLIT